MHTLRLREFTPDLAGHFRDINAAWIASMYTLEPMDLDVIENPESRIVDPGGVILFVEAEGQGIIGTGALRRTAARQFELTKMGVLEAARGIGAGRFLLTALIARAEAMGAECLYLLSNSKSASAIHLYEEFGFVHDDAIMRDFGGHYARCDVAMRYSPLMPVASGLR